MLAPSLKQFSLRVEVLPSYIPVRVAEKILFVGESVQMFENQNVNLTRKGRNLLAHWTPSARALLSWNCAAPKNAWSVSDEQYFVLRFQRNHAMLAWEAGEGAVPPGLENLACPACSLSSSDSAFLSAGSILKNQEDTFAAELHRLKQQPLFSLVDFEQVVDRIRSTVAEVCLS